MQAVVLAGGKGTRLYPYTATFPKPLVPLGNKPIIEMVIDQLCESGVSRITICIGYLSHLVRAFCSTKKWDCEIVFSPEKYALGTAGPLSILENMDEDILVTNGDVITDMDYLAFFRSHLESNADITIARYNIHHQVNYGLLKVDDSNDLIDYIEKPKEEFTVSMGIYAIKTDMIDRFLVKGAHANIPDFVNRVLTNGRKVHTYLHNGIWLDVGNPDDYHEAQIMFGENQ